MSAAGRTVIVVLDGFGVGAMPDAGALRPGDLAADTCGHVLDACRERLGRPLRLPALGALGLGLVRPHPDLAAGTELPVAYGRAALGYPGADTFAGHQTMMGADFSRVTVARLGEHLDAVTEALRSAGHLVTRLDGKPLLVVDGTVLVHDNLEADPGINWNASGRLEDLPFDATLAVARVVRAVAPVARVIAVGGHAARSLDRYVRDGDAGTVGLDTPATGFYRNGGLEVQHLGAPLDHTRQLPELAARAGLPVTLVGKAADILECGSAVRHPAVPTADVLAHTIAAVRTSAPGPALVVANVQETDLAGHQQDTLRYGEVLERADEGLTTLLDLLDSPGDRLIVTGDHGNDPTIGHAYHTREYVPVLIHRPEATTRLALPDADSLADVGATAATSLTLNPTHLANGSPLTSRGDIANQAPPAFEEARPAGQKPRPGGPTDPQPS
ncbi:phosphopentomutase [Streptomyces triticagri]|uniref:Phosphopentomutase n=1 Tax=Streptomyces triticagri TaxID=2293568 RepID=A0A372LXF1_9ACTN|nr:phosphopentomutase [Streptomyces triticagri]RFU83348.1 phosphopentomutase [Streptomyces triticagri]